MQIYAVKLQDMFISFHSTKELADKDCSKRNQLAMQGFKDYKTTGVWVHEQ